MVFCQSRFELRDFNMEPKSKQQNLAKGLLYFRSDPWLSFFFSNRKDGYPIKLGPKEMRTLVKSLPDALGHCRSVSASLEAKEGKYGEGVFDRTLLKEDKLSSVRLEGSVFEGKAFLFLKPYYKPREKTPEEKAREEAEEAAKREKEEEMDEFDLEVERALKKHLEPSREFWNPGRGAVQLVDDDLELIKAFFLETIREN